MSDDEASPGKLHDGYHGWFKSVARTGEDFTPKVISTPVVDNAVGSAWNAGGTWEEVDKSEWAREALKRHILDGFAFDDALHRLRVVATDIATCTGETKIVYSRGKKRCGYELDVKFAWECTDADGATASGHVKLHDFEDTNGEDYEIHVTSSGGAALGKNGVDAIKRWEPSLRQLLHAWKTELLQQ
ncbi:hypothetical protein SPRG_09808 [Saprolegnia parasitica CBS 223.65]|uniref:Activator of Hsp90 ATPase AHSA1-like N-terminal domain-containing protein n=1 Tax=Saprolegnia parasitica (strain CBS 223.65) TaxID=695850 RepID=A0A067C1K9_SAPPC|nr:hypothetical protein SPRG_09808 [Saprolegnia parasitica CBS 223.65]KDO24418.1 hypothetical protein SPRG_09808 [Saprolegnia parasitica CBS 223.65]|eukprot:XP_012204848.1 hypothetical protein SPRG_09808 [Saprolegnia parasitica CBS 223.65]